MTKVRKTGHIAPGGPDFVYVPFDVPEGVEELRFSYDYTGRPSAALDIAVFDTHGHDLGSGLGFRGSSGGGRSEFSISPGGATPGYVPGPIYPGEWHVSLGPYRLPAEGTSWTVTLVMESGVSRGAYELSPAPESLDPAPGWYRGDTHVHSVHSGDATYEPAAIAEDAAAQALDFVVSTEHNTVSNHGVWGRYASSRLLVINGEEVTTRSGHFNVIGVPAGHWTEYRYRPADGVLPSVIRRTHELGAVASANHPYQTCKGCAWEFDLRDVDAIEVWNGPWTPDDELALSLWDRELREGRALVALGGSDVHGRGGANVLGAPQTVVRASSLSRMGVVEGIRSGRAYIAGSPWISLELTAGEDGRVAEIGERLGAEAGDSVRIELRVEGVPGSLASLHTDRGQVYSVPVSRPDDRLSCRVRAGDARYVRAEVRRPHGAMVALTNPIWIGRTG